MKPMCIVLIRSCWSLGTEAWHTLTRDHTVLPATHTFIHKWNELYLPLNSGRRASPHFGCYSFSVPLRVGGWVGLCGLVKYWGCSARPKTVTHPSIHHSSRELHLRLSSPESNALTTRLPREWELALLLMLLLTQGGVVLVSHDERLIRLICTEVWVCGDLNVRRVERGIDEYKKLVQQELATSWQRIPTTAL